ncbi:MexH family multidrug efflux RND transporter periplasmic adaptor subunit (plasmid) [Fulvitalea axinellae]|uniref:MexH family multidrug efflux RND transporter periplasmic adaptor subunit n=1 Tax=Fulvitalea axinellae TaxID=1182444 RepID=A0AAU9DLA3_9BACT|nr:MexH family multidrug efflux RND transporter periplasmic adaptor subunit [Fulvitalea axinellae]
MKKKITYTIVTLAVLAGLVLKLYSNKQELKAEARLAEQITAEIPVKAEEVRIMNLSENWEATGYASANQSVDIVAQISGRVTAVHRKKGQHASAGASLLQIDASTLKSRLATARTNFEKTKKDLERLTILKENDATTDSELEKARIANKQAQAELTSLNEQLRFSQVRAPFSGTLANDFVEKGQVVNSGTKLAELHDLSLVKITVQVPETRVSRLHSGDKATVVFKAIQEKNFEGTVSYIADKAGKGGNFEAEILIENKDTSIKSGMFATATFKATTEGVRLAIPRKAIAGSVLNPEVFVLKNETVSARKITLGKSWGDLYSVTEGLAAGEKIVTQGQINLVDGVKVKVLN